MIKRTIYLIVLCSLWLVGVPLKTVYIIAFVSLFIGYVMIPLIWHYSGAVKRNCIFLNYIYYPADFNKPESRGLHGVHNFYIKSQSNVTVGVWHILPRSLIGQMPLKDSSEYGKWFNDSLSDGHPVILYMHGNAASRAGAHRCELYNVLRNLDCHVVSFDYRGYGDSTSTRLSERGIVCDAKAVYEHINKLRGNAPLVVWGHSMGTGVACHAMASLCQEGKSPSALILESPFTNLREATKYHPMTLIFQKMPMFPWLFLDCLETSGLEFKSDVHIAHIDAPILILHSKDDFVVPFKLGKKLYNTALALRKNLPPVKFVEFDPGHGYRHNYICRSPLIPSILKTFLAEIVKPSKKTT